MQNIPLYPKLVSKVRRSKEKFIETHGVEPNAVLLGTDMLGAIAERHAAGIAGEELSVEGEGVIRLEGLLIIPDGRKASGISVALV